MATLLAPEQGDALQTSEVAGLKSRLPVPARASGPTLLRDVRLQVNGAEHHLRLDPRITLLDALREHLGLTGSKKAAISASAAPARCWSTGG